MARHVLATLTFCAAVMSCQENAATTYTPTSTSSTDGTGTSSELAADRQLWVTVGQDAVGSLTKRLKTLGATATLGPSKNGVATMRVRESQLLDLAQVMHDEFHRCGGFEVQQSEAQAIAALEPVAPLPLATAIAYTIDNGPVVQTLMSSLSNSNVLATVTQLSSYKNRYYTSTTGVAAATWLKTHWETLAQGRSDVKVEAFTHAAWAQPSVILTITGQTLPNEVVVLGAHLDSINQSSSAGTAPGADDDASGIATLTEVIRTLMSNNFKPARTVKFMGYAAEEVGLRGSKEIANKHKADGVNVVGVLQLDMTNFHGSTADIVVIGDFTDASQNAFLGTLIDTYANATRMAANCGYACSDHASWTNNGFRSSLPFEAEINDSNPFIHTEGDTLANSGGNVDHSMKFVRLATAYVGELAKGGFGGPTRDGIPPTVGVTSPGSGATVNGIVIIAADAADNVGIARVRFQVDGTNRGTDQTPPYTLEWDTADEAEGTHTLTAQAFDSSTNSTISTAVTVTVKRVPDTKPDAGVTDAGIPGSAIAVYDPALKTVACAGLSTSCDSSALLTGRGALGPETNAPNTVSSSCADGSQGKFHNDESVDRLVVTSLNGGVLKAGAQAKVDATVWAYSTFSNDKLDLYFAPNASNPSWTLIATLSPTVGGAQTLSATFTLPAGGRQAVRARMRYKGSAAACGTGGYDDHDDLVFAVAP